MTATELMIGDCVIAFIDEKHYGKVISLSENCIKFREDETDIVADVAYESLYPIPITPEILEKNGFERCEDSILYIWKFSQLRLGSMSCFKTANKRWNFDILGKYLSPIKVRGDFDYVHELQHALRLCKIDKEIVL